MIRNPAHHIRSEYHVTDEMVSRAEKEWSIHAGEPIHCEDIGGTLYAFGSELAMLRLEHKMRCGRAQWSENLQTWSYCTAR